AVRARGRALLPLQDHGRAAAVVAVVRQHRPAGQGRRRRRARRPGVDRARPRASPAGDAVRDGGVKIEPAELAKRYFAWVDNMHDWCISRQLWWGHRIPVWYSPDGDMRCVGPDEQAPEGWRQEPDVLDTWFSSALWPFSTLGWPEETPDLRRFYPTDVLLTGYDIIFFWVARMMMFGLYAMDGVEPFRTVALPGLGPH